MSLTATTSSTLDSQVERVRLLREALRSRVVIADGAMGTMLQQFDLSLDDFEGFEGCNEILNVTRRDVVIDIHRAFLAVGVDCIETNTFGANYGNLLEYDIPERTRRSEEHTSNSSHSQQSRMPSSA